VLREQIMVVTEEVRNRIEVNNVSNKHRTDQVVTELVTTEDMEVKKEVLVMTEEIQMVTEEIEVK